jgi:hypothetical protein
LQERIGFIDVRDTQKKTGFQSGAPAKLACVSEAAQAETSMRHSWGLLASRSKKNKSRRTFTGPAATAC